MATYPILRGGESIGHAMVEKKGLYYHFRCECDLSGEVIYRLTVSCGEKTVNLGVPVPEKGHFLLTARVAVSKLGEGKLIIRAVPRHGQLQGQFIPISQNSSLTLLSPARVR